VFEQYFHLNTKRWVGFISFASRVNSFWGFLPHTISLPMLLRRLLFAVVTPIMAIRLLDEGYPERAMVIMILWVLLMILYLFDMSR